MAHIESEKAKILIMAIHGPYEPWLSILHHGQKKTWMRNDLSSRVVNAFGEPINSKLLKIDQQLYFLRWAKNKAVAFTSLAFEAAVKKIIRLDSFRPNVAIKKEPNFGEIWQVKMPDSLLIQGVKNIALFRESLNHEYDFLVTTITSSYINIKLLEQFLSKIDPFMFVGGRIEQSGKLTYQQGSLRVYSRDVVHNLVLHSKRYKHWKIEDIAMGDLVASLYTNYTEIPNATVQADSDLVQIGKSELDTIISYRCKSTESGIRVDSKLMKSLHQRILDRE
jgi:hypothetical protein